MIESLTGHVAPPLVGADVVPPLVGIAGIVAPPVGVPVWVPPLVGAAGVDVLPPDGILGIDPVPPPPDRSAAHSCCCVGDNDIASIGFVFNASAVYGHAASAMFAPPAIAKPDATTAPATNLRMNMVPPLVFN